MTDDKLERIVAARMKLKARFAREMQGTPSLADSRPLGSGPNNRHGMPKLPVGQTETYKWPVLDLGKSPRVDRATFRLTVDGAVAHPYTVDFAGLLALPQVEEESDFHCVTQWSRMDLKFGGVRMLDALALAEPLAAATHLMCYGSDDYTTNLALEEALKSDVLLAHTVDGKPLPHEHGGPVRVITPQLYAWKGAKWIVRLEVLTEDQKGFWERNGYSNTARPWRNDRYA
jgi:DMSO/TMAO reductase YedYZ molybdopterin-dependent catalytic subunit